MKNKLLTGTVSWKRPDLCKKMIKSFLKTRKFADLYVYICNDDTHLEEYKIMMKEFPEVKFEIGKHLFIAEVSNYMSSKFDYEYYQMVNDDHEFVEGGWDVEMIEGCDEYNGWRIAACYMPNELMKSSTISGPLINAPTAEIFSRKIIKTLGFYNFPTFTQYGCDQYIMDLGEDLGGIIPFCGKILHNCCNIDRMEKDEVYDFIYSKENMIKGNIAIMQWLDNRKIIVDKIMRAKKEDEERQTNA